MANPVQLFASHEGRNSSRVLAPPGGQSSIFFNDTPDTAVHRNGPPKADRNASNIFNHHEAPAPSARVALQQQQAYVPQPAAAYKPMEAAPSQAQAPADGHGKRASDMHGQHATSLAAGKHRDVHTSSRVLAPPGGHCHNIFG